MGSSVSVAVALHAEGPQPFCVRNMHVEVRTFFYL